MGPLKHQKTPVLAILTETSSNPYAKTAKFSGFCSKTAKFSGFSDISASLAKFALAWVGVSGQGGQSGNSGKTVVFSKNSEN